MTASLDEEEEEEVEEEEKERRCRFCTCKKKGSALTMFFVIVIVSFTMTVAMTGLCSCCSLPALPPQNCSKLCILRRDCCRCLKHCSLSLHNSIPTATADITSRVIS